MEFKNTCSHTTSLVVRASSKSSSGHYTKKSLRKRDSNRELLPCPLDYYSEKLERFHPRGKQATALCPFHNDRNPSFSVNLKTGAFLCFACGARGTSIAGFHAKKHNLTFAAACKALEVKHG